MKKFFDKHKILKEVTPLLSAVLLLAILFLSPLTSVVKYSKKDLKEFANDPLSRTAFVGYSIKSQAFQNKDFLPILGSSELEHVDAFHPSVWANKYPEGYTPFLAGQPGTASITHFFYVNSAARQLKNDKLVLIVSPQWFKPHGIPVPALENFVSKGEIYSWLRTADPKSIATQQLARRLIKVSSFDDDFLIDNALQSLAHKKVLNGTQKSFIYLAQSFWKKEDSLFSYFDSHRLLKTSESAKIKKYSRLLPDKKPSQYELDARAYELGRKAANNNPYEINNGFWKSHKQEMINMRGKQTHVDYLQSPEWFDFQQLLNQFAANKNDVLFIIQPVNGKFDQYTGLPFSTVKSFSNKITYQLKQQGFNNIDDMTDRYFDSYYSGDTIHFGTRGWLESDQAIDAFVKEKNSVGYNINNKKFLSDEWQKNKSF